MKWIIIFVAISFSPLSFAGKCEGLVDSVQLNRSGFVEIISEELYGVGSNGKAICNIQEVWKGVGLDTCKGWYALMLSASTLKIKVLMNYDSAIECVDQPDWGDAHSPWVISTK